MAELVKAKVGAESEVRGRTSTAVAGAELAALREKLEMMMTMTSWS